MPLQYREPQLALFNFPPTDKRVRWLELLLIKAPGWRSAARIRKLSGNRLSDRRIRALASASPWIISGQEGYKHLGGATADEIDHAANWLESQAKKMADRAGHIRRSAHRRFG